MASMQLINIKAFLEREQMMDDGKQVDRRTRVLEFRDDEATEYAILSHRWIDPTEVGYEEMVTLAQMDRQERDEVRGRRGYKKILDTCEQAKKDGYEWAWIDTCCIDKRSSAELSEAINSMYRWYANSRVCYTYLHDVSGSSFPTEEDHEKYSNSNGWPEWFSRGWTLQEMIAPSNVQFFNKDWQVIGDKKTLACTLACITHVPEYILKEGFFGNRPCVAQIMSWAARRRTTRVEDRAYSLMGLLDVNMPMLYGEGKKAFHRLQLEVIRSSNDQSIFAWGGNERTGSILADEPSSFEDCSEVELMDHNEFIEHLRWDIPLELQPSWEDRDCLGTFLITNRGIQIRMFLRRHRDSDSVFTAFLPCLNGRSPITINLALWKSNYYRYPRVPTSAMHSLQLRQVYLGYQDMSCNVAFEIDDSAITENGFACCNEPSKFTENTITLTGANSFCVKTYTERQGDSRFAVAFGQCFGLDWVYLLNDPPNEYNWLYQAKSMLRESDRTLSMANMPSGGDSPGRLCFRHHPVSTWILRISRIVWERSKIGVRIEVFRDSGFHCGLGWKSPDIEVGEFFCLTHGHGLSLWLFTESRLSYSGYQESHVA